MDYSLRLVEEFDANAYPSDYSSEYACKCHAVASYRDLIHERHTVLEVGIGADHDLYDHCIACGAHWEGIDIFLPPEHERPENSRRESVERISSSDETFDFVIGNQTLEHWEEYGCPIETGLSECFRVCKTGGNVLLNFPLHVHGARDFVFGDLNAIVERFAPFVSDIEVRSYENAYHPFPHSYHFRQYPPLSDKRAYICDIRATKRTACPTLRRIYLVKNRFVRTILGMPFSYTLFLFKRKLFMKLGLLPNVPVTYEAWE